MYTSESYSDRFLAVFDVADGSTVDVAPIDLNANQIAHDPVSGHVFYLTNFDVGLLVDCGNGMLQGMSVRTPDIVPPLDLPGALMWDVAAEQLLVASQGEEGVLYAYDPSANDWSQRGTLNSVNARAAQYFSGDGKLYMADEYWKTYLRYFASTGAFEDSVALSPALTALTDSHVQIRESGSSLYYILQGHDGVNPHYSFVLATPTTGETFVIFP